MSIETMKLALELLDRQWKCSGVWSLEEAQDVADALRQAIEQAQPEQAHWWKPSKEQFSAWCRVHGMTEADRDAFDDASSLWQLSFASLIPFRQPEPSVGDVELAAQIMSDCGCSTNNEYLLDRITDRLAKHRTPRQLWIGLTDEQIERICTRYGGDCEVECITRPSENLAPPQFPVVLRKMWSGAEVQEWINKHWRGV